MGGRYVWRWMMMEFPFWKEVGSCDSFLEKL
ncbi:hypothetical protein LINPERHAP1_LOCUS28877 [Linum perenne]